jgi:hypothetical protein
VPEFISTSGQEAAKRTAKTGLYIQKKTFLQKEGQKFIVSDNLLPQKAQVFLMLALTVPVTGKKLKNVLGVLRVPDQTGSPSPGEGEGIVQFDTFSMHPLCIVLK